MELKGGCLRGGCLQLVHMPACLYGKPAAYQPGAWAVRNSQHKQQRNRRLTATVRHADWHLCAISAACPQQAGEIVLAVKPNHLLLLLQHPVACSETQRSGAVSDKWS